MNFFSHEPKKSKSVTTRLFLFLFASFISSNAFALQIPEKPQAYVNDYAHLLSDNARGQIENTLTDFEKTTSTQVVVAIFPSLEGEALEDFSIRLAEKWKIGSKKNSNGIILLIFRDDHKIRIEVGYGLEGALPDITASQIIRNEITPAFRAGNYDKGVSDAVHAIIQCTKGEYNAAINEPIVDTFQKHSGIMFILLILYLILPIACYAGIVIASILNFGFPAGFVIGSITASFFFVLRQLFMAASAGTTISSHGTGGWGGGSYSSGGFSGGGFSGGGGGSFGGGGASGGW